MSVRTIFAALLLAGTATATAAPVPKEQLLVPPNDAAHYVVVSMAGKHGDQWVWTRPDGSIASRYSQSLRGCSTETDEVMTLGSDGLPTAITIRGITPNGDAAETFAVSGKARCGRRRRQRRARGGARILPRHGGTNMAHSLGGELWKRGTGGRLYPSGRATLRKGPTLAIKGPSGQRP